MNAVIAMEKGVALARPANFEGVNRGFFPKKAIGLYVVLWNNGGFKGNRRVDVALLESSRGEKIVYRYSTGPRIGRRFAAVYNIGDQVAVYNPEELTMLCAYIKDINQRKGFEK